MGSLGAGWGEAGGSPIRSPAPVAPAGTAETSPVRDGSRVRLWEESNSHLFQVMLGVSEG